MRLSQSLETSLGKIIVRELTPAHIIRMKDQMTEIQDALSQKSTAQIILEDDIAAMMEVGKPSNADKVRLVSTEVLLAKERQNQAGLNNLKLLQDVPKMAEAMSGDCLEVMGSAQGIEDLGFSELKDLWDVFKEVNASFLGVIPIDQMAQNLVQSFRSNLLQPEPPQVENKGG